MKAPRRFSDKGLICFRLHTKLTNGDYQKQYL